MATTHVVTGDQYRIIDRRMREIKRQLDQDDGSPLDPDAVAIALQQIIEDRFGDQSEFSVMIDYNQSLADMVAAGQYDWVNSDITADHFPIKGSGTVKRTLLLIHFNRSMSSEETLKELDSQGLRLATIEELLAFGAEYPSKQREFPIICLDSVWQNPNGDRDVPCLGRDGSRRSLDLSWLDRVWYDDCRFLAVRK